MQPGDPRAAEPAERDGRRAFSAGRVYRASVWTPGQPGHGPIARSMKPSLRSLRRPACSTPGGPRDVCCPRWRSPPPSWAWWASSSSPSWERWVCSARAAPRPGTGGAAAQRRPQPTTDRLVGRLPAVRRAGPPPQRTRPSRRRPGRAGRPARPSVPRPTPSGHAAPRRPDRRSGPQPPALRGVTVRRRARRVGGSVTPPRGRARVRRSAQRRAGSRGS